jgi:hypothetical protein
VGASPFLAEISCIMEPPTPAKPAPACELRGVHGIFAV